MKTVHAGTTPSDRAVIVRIVDTDTKEVTEITVTATRALRLAAELIQAANAVLECKTADVGLIGDEL